MSCPPTVFGSGSLPGDLLKWNGAKLPSVGIGETAFAPPPEKAPEAASPTTAAARIAPAAQAIVTAFRRFDPPDQYRIFGA